MAMNKVLDNLQFYNRYKNDLTAGSFKFITKAYHGKDKTVAVFPSEIKCDCYFQLPTFSSREVPDNRKYIYRLKKDSLVLSRYLTDAAGKIRVPVVDLEIWSDPYAEVVSVMPETTENTATPTIKQEVEKHLVDNTPLVVKLAQAKERVKSIMLELNKLEVTMEGLKEEMYGSKN